MLADNTTAGLSVLAECTTDVRQWYLQNCLQLNLNIRQGSHYLLIVKFQDFSRTFKDPQISYTRTNSGRKFT